MLPKFFAVVTIHVLPTVHIFTDFRLNKYVLPYVWDTVHVFDRFPVEVHVSAEFRLQSECVL